MSVKLFSNHTLPEKYRQQILGNPEFCRRGDSFISPDWIEFQLGRASYIIVVLDNWDVCGFLIGFNFDKADPKNSELEDSEKAHNVWWLDTICRNAQPKYKMVTGLLIERFFVEAMKHRVSSIKLYATTPESAKAYLKYGFNEVGKADQDGGVEMQIAMQS